MQSTTPKTSRGIQEADVWAAADALLAQGQKPTIEKVRLHMGRGSPNTVAPMLDAWFGTLGGRLGLNEQTQQIRSTLPNEILEITQTLWSAALRHAKEIAHNNLQQQIQTTQQLQQEVQEQQKKLVQREENLAQQKEAMNAALQLAQAQREDLSRRLDEMQQQVLEREKKIEKQAGETNQLRQLQEELRMQHTQSLEAAAYERQRLVEQFAGNERRLLTEVDRNRQEVEKLKKLQEETEQAAAARYEELHARQLKTDEDLLTTRAALINAQQALSMVSERAAELKQQLKNQEITASLAQEYRVETPARGTRSLQRKALSQRAALHRKK